MAAASDKLKTKEEVKQLILDILEDEDSMSKDTQAATLNTQYACNADTGFGTSCAQVITVEKSTLESLLDDFDAEGMDIQAFAIPKSFKKVFWGTYDFVLTDSNSIVLQLSQYADDDQDLKELTVFIEIERTPQNDTETDKLKIVGLTLPSEDKDIYGPKHEQAVKLVRQFTDAFYAMSS